MQIFKWFKGRAYEDMKTMKSMDKCFVINIIAIRAINLTIHSLYNLILSFLSFSLSISLLVNKSLEPIAHEESWTFYPNGVRTAGFCDNPSFHLYWPNKQQDGTYNTLTTRELIVQPGYILQFKVSAACYNYICYYNVY